MHGLEQISRNVAKHMETGKHLRIRTVKSMVYVSVFLEAHCDVKRNIVFRDIDTFWSADRQKILSMKKYFVCELFHHSGV